jgi:hypothetical protein
MTGAGPSPGRPGDCHDGRPREPSRGHVATCERLGVHSRSKGVHAERRQPGPIGRLPALPGGRSGRTAGHEREDAEGDEGSLPARLGAPDPAIGNDRGSDVPQPAGRREPHGSPRQRDLQGPDLQDAARKAPYPLDADRDRDGLHPQGGLAGALVAIARGLPDGLLGVFQARGRLVDLVGLHDGAFAYPFVRNLVRTELLDSGYYTRSQRFRVQPDCERIATLDQARTATVRWWEQQQAAESRLCAALLGVCKRASIPLTGGGG